MLRYLAYNNIPHGWSLGLKGTVGRKTVPSLHWVFQPLTTTSSSWPQHPPVDRLAVTGQVTARLLQAFSLVPLSYAGTIQGSLCCFSQPTNCCLPQVAPQSVHCHQIPHRFGWESSRSNFHRQQPSCSLLLFLGKLLVFAILPFCFFATSSQDTLTLPGWSYLFCHHVIRSALRGEDSPSWVFSQGHPPCSISGLLAGGSAWLGCGWQVSGPLSQSGAWQGSDVDWLPLSPLLFKGVCQHCQHLVMVPPCHGSHL